MVEIRNTIFITHASVSILVLIVIFIGIYRSYKNKKIENPSNKKDKLNSLYTLILLYLQSISGLILIHVKETQARSTQAEIEKMISQSFFRFWSLEHLVIMFFVLAIAQISYIIVERIPENEAKNKFRLQYYSIILLLVLFSLMFALLRHRT